MIKLNDEQLRKLADIFADFGIVIIGSALIPTILGQGFTSLSLIGISLTIIFWLSSLRLLKHTNQC